MAFIAPLVVAGIAAYKTIHGAQQESAANKLRANALANRPVYNIQDEYYKNQSLAQDMAQSGLSDASKNYYGGQGARGLTAGISATLQGGGDVNNIGNLYDKYNQGNLAIAAKDSELQNQNLQYLIDRNKDLAGQKTQAWAINEYEPFKDQLKAAASQHAAGEQSINNGLSEFGSAAATYFGAKTPTDPTTSVRDAQIASPSNPALSSPVPSVFGPSNPFGSNPQVDRSMTPNTFSPSMNPSGIMDSPVQYKAGQNVLDEYKMSPYYNSLQTYYNQQYA